MLAPALVLDLAMYRIASGANLSNAAVGAQAACQLEGVQGRNHFPEQEAIEYLL